MKKITDVFEKIDSLIFFVAQAAVFIMMIVTMADVIMRYVFNRSILIAYTFSGEYLMVILVFLSLSYVMKMGGHIRLDLFIRHFPEKFMKFLDIVYLLLAAGLMFVIGYQGMLLTSEAYINNYTAAGIIPWPTWLSVVWVPIGSYMFTLRLLLLAIQTLFNVKTNELNESSN